MEIETTKALDIRKFTPAQLLAIGTEMPRLTRGQVIHAELGGNAIHLSVEPVARKADEKATYPVRSLQGGCGVQYFASAKGGGVLIVGTPGITTKPGIEALVKGFEQILAQSGSDAEDILFAPIDGAVEAVIATSAAGPWTSLAAYGFDRVGYNPTLGGFIASRKGDNHLYFLPLVKAQAGKLEVSNWVQTQKSFQTGAITRFPYRISRANLAGVPVVTERGMENVDLTNLKEGQIRFNAPETSVKGVPNADVLGDTDDQGVLVASLASGQARSAVIVPRTNMRAALAEMSA